MKTLRVEVEGGLLIRSLSVEIEDEGMWNPNVPEEEVEKQKKVLMTYLAELLNHFTFQLAGVMTSPLAVMFLDQMRRSLEEVLNHQLIIQEKLQAGDDPRVIVAEYAAEVGSPTTEVAPDMGDLSAWEDALDDSPLDLPPDEESSDE